MERPILKSSTTLILQVIVVLVGLVALFLMLGEPHIEGRNAHATIFEIYFKDPSLAYAYVGSIPFFVALHRVFRILGQIRQNGTVSPETVRGCRVVKRCALLFIGFVVGGMVFIFLGSESEDRPAGLFMSLLAVFPAGVIATTAAIFERNLRSALMRAESDRA